TKPSFNFYWIYAIIAVGIIAMQVFTSGGNTRQISPNDFIELAKDGYVEKIIIINNQEVEVFIADDRLEDLQARDKKYQTITESKGQFGETPQLTFTPPEPKFFMDQVKEVNAYLVEEGQKPIDYTID